MDIEEKLNALPQLRVEGNRLYTEKNFQAAAEKYGEALGMLEQLVLRWVLVEKHLPDNLLLVQKRSSSLEIIWQCCPTFFTLRAAGWTALLYLLGDDKKDDLQKDVIYVQGLIRLL